MKAARRKPLPPPQFLRRGRDTTMPKAYLPLSHHTPRPGAPLLVLSAHATLRARYIERVQSTHGPRHSAFRIALRTDPEAPGTLPGAVRAVLEHGHLADTACALIHCKAPQSHPHRTLCRALRAAHRRAGQRPDTLAGTLETIARWACGFTVERAERRDLTLPRAPHTRRNVYRTIDALLDLSARHSTPDAPLWLIYEDRAPAREPVDYRRELTEVLVDARNLRRGVRSVISLHPAHLPHRAQALVASLETNRVDLDGRIHAANDFARHLIAELETHDLQAEHLDAELFDELFSLLRPGRARCA